MAAEKNCTVLIALQNNVALPTPGDIKDALETGSHAEKLAALKQAILLTLSGEKMPQLLMSIIRFILPVDDYEHKHQLKKTTQVYLEVVEKFTPDGKLLPEMILVCNYLRNDLNHANEFVRGSTLRFLSKLRDPELLEPLVPSVINNVQEPRHAYVRRNAVLALFAIFRTWEHLAPNAPEIVEKLLMNDIDMSAKRAAFIMLFNTAPDRAQDYIAGVLDQVSTFGSMFQLAVLELVRKVCRTDPLQKSRYIRSVFDMLEATSDAVAFEAAQTLVHLSNSPTAIKAAASAYTKLLVEQSDNNVKLIVLEKITELKQRHTKVLQTILMDILRALDSPDMDIRRKTLAIALDLLSPRNVTDVVNLLKKEMVKSSQAAAANENEKIGEYRQMLIQSIHQAAVKFPEIAGSVVDVMMDFLSDPNTSAAVDVIMFVREVIEKYPHLRPGIKDKLIEIFGTIKSSRVYRIALWILGEHCQQPADVLESYNVIKIALGGEQPLTQPNEAEEEAAAAPPQEATTQIKTVLLHDGTYGSQVVTTEPAASAASGAEKEPNLRGLLTGGDFFLGSVLATTLTKFVIRAGNFDEQDATLLQVRNFSAECMAVLCQIGLLAQASVTATNAGAATPSTNTSQTADLDCLERVGMCLRVLTDKDDSTRKLWADHCSSVYSNMLAEKEAQNTESAAGQDGDDKEAPSHQTDDLIQFRMLRAGVTASDELDDDGTSFF